MTTALILFALQGVLGAFDTLYYHEWRARLPARAAMVASELRLHAARDFLYAVIFGTLPLVQWRGLFGYLFAAILLAEILVTFADFATEARVRKSFGDVYPGERITHGAMAIIYGAALAFLLPELASWCRSDTGLAPQTSIDEWLKWTLVAMACGVFLSGVRDLIASGGRPGTAWPWEGSDT